MQKLRLRGVIFTKTEVFLLKYYTYVGTSLFVTKFPCLTYFQDALSKESSKTAPSGGITQCVAYGLKSSG